MPEFDFDFNFEELNYRQPPQIPQEWLTMVCKLHPVTAAVVWQVLTSTISATTITLAQSSPDRGRFNLVSIVGGDFPKEEMDRLRDIGVNLGKGLDKQGSDRP